MDGADGFAGQARELADLEEVFTYIGAIAATVLVEAGGIWPQKGETALVRRGHAATGCFLGPSPRGNLTLTYA